MRHDPFAALSISYRRKPGFSAITRRLLNSDRRSRFAFYVSLPRKAEVEDQRGTFPLTLSCHSRQTIRRGFGTDLRAD